jgi:hypothetical protein
VTFLGPIERLKMWNWERGVPRTLGIVLRRKGIEATIEAEEKPADSEARYTFHPFKSEAME